MDRQSQNEEKKESNSILTNFISKFNSWTIYSKQDESVIPDEGISSVKPKIS